MANPSAGVDGKAKLALGFGLRLGHGLMQVSQHKRRLPVSDFGREGFALGIAKSSAADPDFVCFGQATKPELHFRRYLNAVQFKRGSFARRMKFDVRKGKVRENLCKTVDVVGVVVEQIPVKVAVRHSIAKCLCFFSECGGVAIPVAEEFRYRRFSFIVLNEACNRLVLATSYDRAAANI